MNKQNPFSLYDFLGYLIPGGLLIYSFLTVRFVNKSLEFNLDLLIENFTKVNFEGVFVFIITAYSLGHILSFVSSITIETYANWKYSYPSKYLLGHINKSFWIKFTRKNWKQNFWRGMLSILLLPIVMLDFLLGQVLGFKIFYQKPLDEFLRNSIIHKVDALINQLGLGNEKIANNFKPEVDDFHRIVTHYTFENAKQHQFRMVNYVALYGFLRNLSLIFNILSWYYLIQLLREAKFELEFSPEKILALLIIVSISYIAFMAFMKFYRRYTLEGFMLLVVDENIKIESTPNIKK